MLYCTVVCRIKLIKRGRDYMNNKKKLLSIITALAITVSAFTGFAVTASATETPIVSYTFDETSDAAWKISGTNAGVFTNEIVSDDASAETKWDSKYYKIATTKAESGGRTASVKIPATIPGGTDVVKLDFDWYSGSGGTNNSSDMIFRDSSEKDIFKISDVVSSKDIAFNGTELKNSEGAALANFKWYKVSAVLDFETHTVLNISFTENGQTSPSAIVKSEKFIDQSASDVANVGIVLNRKTNITADMRLDNFTATRLVDEYYKVTLTVKDSAGNAVKDANVTLDGHKYVTDATGQIETKLANGEYKYTVSKAGYEATVGKDDDATGTVTVNGNAVATNITYSPKSYVAVPDKVTISGGQSCMVAPTTAESFTSAAFTVAVTDQEDVAIEDADISWTIVPTGSETADSKVTIANGVVSVAKGFDAGENHVKKFTVTATATKNNESKSATTEITVSDYLFYESGVGGSSYGETEHHTVGGGDYITTGSTKNLENTITFPEKIEFKPGTAQLVSFMTTMNTKVYTFQRSVKLATAEGTDLVTLDYVNLDIGTNAAWSSTTSILGTTLGSIPAVDKWQKVTVLFKTNTNGVTKAIATVGDTETDLGKITGQDLGEIKLKVGDCGGGTDRYVALKDIAVSQIDVTGMSIDGATEFSTVKGHTVTKEYSVDAMVVDDGETFTWETTIPGATITPDSQNSQKATLTVPGTTVNGGTIKVTSSEGAAKTATLKVNVEKAKVKSATINGSQTIDKSNTTSKYTVTNVIDQFNNDITELVTPKWSLSNVGHADEKVTFNVTAEEAKNITIVKAKYDEEGVLTGVTTENKALTEGSNEVAVTGLAGTKVMLWDSLKNMKPISNEVKTIPSANVETAEIGADTGVLAVNDNGDIIVVATILDSAIEYPVSVGEFSKVVENPEAGDIDVSDIVSYGATTYTVTLEDRTTLEKTAKDNKITLTEADLNSTDKIEIVPNYKFNLGSSTVDGYVTANATKSNGYGFTKEPTVVTSTIEGAKPVQTDGVNLNTNQFEVNLPDGRYDMTFSKTETGRTHIRVNGYYVIPEADYTDGDGSDPITVPGTYTQKDVVVEGGIVTVSADNWGGSSVISSVEITKKSDLEPRKTHIWIAGDSTVTNYRPTPTGDNWAAGKRRTGWGQLFEYYLQDSVIVDDYAHSGDYAVNWYNNTFPSVIQKAQAGDYLFIQFGINDRADKNNSPVSKMEEYLGKMVDECRAKGVIPVLITPEICISQYGSVGEHEKSTGSGNAAWFNANKTVAEDKDVLLIDLADLSGELWKTLGKTWVQHNYFLYNNETNEEVDNQHMSYQGAKLVAQLVATNIYDQIENNTKTGKNESFNAIPVNAKAAADITYTDAEDNTEKTTSDRQAVQFSLDKSAAAGFEQAD